MINSFVLKNVRLGSRNINLLVVDGKIGDIATHEGDSIKFSELPQGVTDADVEKLPVEDGQGFKLFPSFVDAHAHLREPGQEYKETIASGLSAAVHGGFGVVMAMANTNPVNDNAAVTSFMINEAKKHFPYGPRLYPIGALTKGLEGKELAPMAELRDAGCVAFSNDGRPVTNTEIMRRGIEYAADQSSLVIDHCEDEFLAAKSHMNESELNGLMGLKGQPDIAETIHVQRDILLSEYLHTPVHLAHISCKRSIEAIMEAKNRGVRITAETCPHYLFLTEEFVRNYNTAAKVNPPLRKDEDVNAMREALTNGTIDILVTDHAPHADHEKEAPMDEAPFGISGLDTALSLTWELVCDGVITEKELVQLWCYNPATMFSIPVNTFRPSDPADFFLFNPEETWTLTPESMHSKGKNTPFMGRQMLGKVKAHWMQGVKVV